MLCFSAVRTVLTVRLNRTSANLGAYLAKVVLSTFMVVFPAPFTSGNIAGAVVQYGHIIVIKCL